MADKTTNIPQASSGQSGKEIVLNGLIDAISDAGVYGRNYNAASGLTWAWLGGKILIDGVVTTIANGTIALAASNTHYLEADRTGAVTANTSGFTAGRIPLYTLTAGTSGFTDWIDQRPTWLTDYANIAQRLSLSVAGSSNVTLSAAQARARLLEFTGVLTGSISVIVPNGPQEFTCFNNTTGAFTLTCRTAGTGVLLPRGVRVRVYSDGTNVVPVNANQFWQSIAYAATLGTLDAQFGERLMIGTLTGNTTAPAPTNPQIGQALEFLFTQDATGGRTITWNGAFKKAADGAGTANQQGCTRFVYNGTNWIQQGGALAFF